MHCSKWSWRWLGAAAAAVAEEKMVPAGEAAAAVAAKTELLAQHFTEQTLRSWETIEKWELLQKTANYFLDHGKDSGNI